MSVTTRYQKDGTDIGTYFCDLTNTQTVAGAKTFSTTPIVGTMGTSDSSTSAASTAYVKNQAYATKADPTFTGTVTLPAPASDSNTTVAATTAFVISKVPSLTAYATLASPTFTGNVVVGTSTAPSAGNMNYKSDGTTSLNFIDSANVLQGRIFSSGGVYIDTNTFTVRNATGATSIFTANATNTWLTGVVTAPAPGATSNDTTVATTAFVTSKIPDTSTFAPKASPTFTGDITIGADGAASYYMKSGATTYGRLFANTNGTLLDYNGAFTIRAANGAGSTIDIVGGGIRINGNIGSNSYNNNYAWFKNNGGSNTSSQSPGGNGDRSYALVINSTSGMYMLGGELDIGSDSRIKKDIENIDIDYAINCIRKISPSYFNLIYHNSNHVGFIAQDVENCIPEAVKINIEFIPNILCNGTVEKIDDNDDIYKIVLDNPINTEKILMPNKIKLIKDTIVNDKCEIYEIIDDRILMIKGNIDDVINNGCVFVYGTLTNDFRSVDKNCIFTYGIAAIKKLDLEIYDLKNEVNYLKEKIDKFELLFEGFTGTQHPSGASCESGTTRVETPMGSLSEGANLVRRP